MPLPIRIFMNEPTEIDRLEDRYWRFIVKKLFAKWPEFFKYSEKFDKIWQILQGQILPMFEQIIFLFFLGNYFKGMFQYYNIQQNCLKMKNVKVVKLFKVSHNYNTKKTNHNTHLLIVIIILILNKLTSDKESMIYYSTIQESGIKLLIQILRKKNGSFSEKIRD